ncbi:unnamed protein product [Anisakis simplex]|uniref:ABC transporter permease n=1 Tax=Anisakis simplex TaxID=6269 RepID=A0A0M3K0Q5_ANISI|nr:unnamed protein product [Anisakis simplex]
MRYSILRLASQFLRNKEHVFADRSVFVKDFWRVSGASVLTQIVVAVIIEEFAFPTPDIVYDLRMYLSPDFAEFARYGERGEKDYRLDNSLRSFHISEGRVQRIRERGISKEGGFD